MYQDFPNETKVIVRIPNMMVKLGDDNNLELIQQKAEDHEIFIGIVKEFRPMETFGYSDIDPETDYFYWIERISDKELIPVYPQEVYPYDPDSELDLEMN